MADPRDLVIDLYSPLSHKTPLSPSGTGGLAPNWVPRRERRRLDAYRVLSAYLGNVARWFDRDDPEDPNSWENRREYGDAGVLVRRVRAAVLGDELQIVVDGADVDIPPMPDLPDEPVDPGEGASDIEKRIYEVARQRWEDTATAIVDEWEQAIVDTPGLQSRQDWLRDWATAESFVAKAIEAETDTVGLGDGVYALYPSTAKGRPTLVTYDPGFYFPVLDDGEVEQFPDRVHVAWEFEVDGDDGSVERFVRRVTWELVPVGQAIAAQLDPASPDLAGDFASAIAADEATVVDPKTGELARWYPWQDRTVAGAAPSPTTCVFSDGTWKLDDVRGTFADLSDEGAMWAALDDGRTARNVDMRIDFIPVVHLSNTPDTREHYGASLLLLVAQLLDDISQCDTDLEGAAAIAALPIIGLFGAVESQDLALRAGAILSSPDPAGSLEVVDLTKAIPALQGWLHDLLERTSVNSSVPAEVLGRSASGTGSTSGADQISGISRLLKQGTFKQLIEELRLARSPKYSLLLKMTQRMAQAMGVLEAGPNPSASVAFGAYLPADLGQVITNVKDLLEAHAISRRTALRMLVDAGLDIDDATEELTRIEAEDTAAAVQVADATGSEAVAAKRLGIDPADLPAVADPATSVPPTVPVNPPAPGSGA